MIYIILTASLIIGYAMHAYASASQTRQELEEYRKNNPNNKSI